MRYHTLLTCDHLERIYPGDSRILDASAFWASQHLGSSQPATIDGTPKRNRHLPCIDAGTARVAITKSYRANHMACLVDHQCSGRRWGDGNLAADDTCTGSDRTVGGDVERAGKAVVLGGPIEGRSIGESTLPCSDNHRRVHVGNFTPRLAVESGCWAKAIDTNRPESVNGIDNALMNDIVSSQARRSSCASYRTSRRMASRPRQRLRLSVPHRPLRWSFGQAYSRPQHDGPISTMPGASRVERRRAFLHTCQWFVTGAVCPNKWFWDSNFRGWMHWKRRAQCANSSEL